MTIIWLTDDFEPEVSFEDGLYCPIAYFIYH